MKDIINKEIEEWKRPWNLERFDDLYNRDERFFSILLKGALNWLTQNIILYNKPILHFIFNTGSSYMYVESNGYEFSWNETSGEDSMYMQTPRCIVELGDISVAMEELSNPYATAQYERRTGKNIKGSKRRKEYKKRRADKEEVENDGRVAGGSGLAPADSGNTRASRKMMISERWLEGLMKSF